MPEVIWPSPGNGTIKEIRYGSRRVIEKVTIILDEESEELGEKIYSKDTLSNLNKELSTSFIFATHDEKIMAYLRRIIHLDDGEITEDEIIENPKAHD